LGAVLFSFPDYETETGQVILGNLQRRWSAMARSGREEKTLGGGTRDLYDEDPRVNALALQSIFAINRYEVASKILDAATRGHVVLDRYWLSGVVYGACDGLDEEWLIRIHEQLPQPDVWFLLDVPPSASVERRPERRDRYEADGNMGKRREIYCRLFEERQADTMPVLFVEDGVYGQYEYLTKWCVIDGLRSIGEIHARVCDELSRRGLEV
jgi:thymidylate kinase